MFNRVEKGLFLATALYALIACTSIDTHRNPPEDWPELKVTEKKVGFWELQNVCGGGWSMILFVQYMACAWINFEQMTCGIYYAADGEHGQMSVEHEREHCKGRDHVGSSMLRDYWDKWKSAK